MNYVKVTAPFGFPFHDLIFKIVTKRFPEPKKGTAPKFQKGKSSDHPLTKEDDEKAGKPFFNHFSIAKALRNRKIYEDKVRK